MAGNSKGDKESEGGFRLSISLGKEIDVALGDIVRGLLKRPAEEAGNLIADGIGIFSDRVRRKREINVQLGVEEVRKKLEADSVDMKDITPPKEEDLHLLMNGLSLTDDGYVRNMWAGLFAKALEPNSSVSAERPFISVLQSLSPSDAKVIDFLAFIKRKDRESSRSAKTFVPKDITKMTLEEEEELNVVRKWNVKLRKEAIRAIEGKAEEYGLKSITDPNWAENLMRQGLIERPPLRNWNSGNHPIRLSDEQGVLRAFERLNAQLEQMKQAAERSSSAPKNIFSKGVPGAQLQLEIQLSNFGLRFAKSCGLM